jgi:hypothetical protein
LNLETKAWSPSSPSPTSRNMAGKKNARSEPVAAPMATATPAPPAKAPSTPTRIPIAAPPQPKAVAEQGGWAQVFQNLYDYYLTETPQRTRLLDVFLLFLALVGALQFLYCILAGNYVCLEKHESARQWANESKAFQCFLVGFLWDSWTVRLDE